MVFECQQGVEATISLNISFVSDHYFQTAVRLKIIVWEIMNT